MSRDYKPRQTKNSNKGSPFLTGLLIGFLLGVFVAVALTVYLKGDTSPFQDSNSNSSAVDPLKPSTTEKTSAAKNNQQKQPTNDFDFYTILPETESTVSEKEIKENPNTIKSENNFLQVGAFQNEADADNMKAKLALQGFEAMVQTATIPDKGTWHRVRIGPLKDVSKINKLRLELQNNGFKTDIIKVRR